MTTTLLSPQSASAPLWDVAQVYCEYRECILRYLVRRVSDAQLAEDLTQETFVRAFKAFPAMPDDLRLRPWLYRIATNLAYDALRRQQVITWSSLDVLACEPACGDGDDPQAEYSSSELVHLALARLPALYCQALLLYQEGYTYEQVARVVGIVPTGVKMYLTRARRQLRACYQTLEQEVAHV